MSHFIQGSGVELSVYNENNDPWEKWLKRWTQETGGKWQKIYYNFAANTNTGLPVCNFLRFSYLQNKINFESMLDFFLITQDLNYLCYNYAQFFT